MTTKIIQDTRSTVSGGLSPIKISISSKGRTAYLPTGVAVSPPQWDARAGRIVGHPRKVQLNAILMKRKMETDTALYALQDEGRLHGLTATEIRDVLAERLNPSADKDLFMPRLKAYSERRMAEGTRYTYTHTADKIRGFCARTGTRADRLRFTDITPRWLTAFNEWMEETAPSQNARNIILRDIRTIFNDAIDDEVTAYYPFRKFKIKAAPTKSRALTVEQVRALFSYEGRYIDIFKLCFYLGGISFCDLASLTERNIVAGRIEYRRQKTGQFCSIGLQPEAIALIERHRGRRHLLFIADEGDYHTFLHNMNVCLKKLGSTYNPVTKRWEGSPVCPTASHYWARYSVATIAAENGTPEEVIAAMLGHSSNTSVTSIYTRANRNRQVDTALRSVIDTIKFDNLK